MMPILRPATIKFRWTQPNGRSPGTPMEFESTDARHFATRGLSVLHLGFQFAAPRARLYLDMQIPGHGWITLRHFCADTAADVFALIAPDLWEDTQSLLGAETVPPHIPREEASR